MKNIGFIGIGVMGRRMVKNIINAGYKVFAYDILESAQKKAIELGAELKDSPKEIAEYSDIVITMLPNSLDVESVVFSKTGLISGFKKDSVLIDMSSSIPSSTRMISEQLKIKNVSMLDAPVSGGPIGAENATLSIMVGGDEKVFLENEVFLNTMGQKILYMGSSGAGHTTKAANNMLFGTTLVAACEAICLGVKAGINPEKLIDAISSSSGQSYAVNKIKNYVLSRNFKPGFELDLLTKDIDTAMKLSHENKFPVPVSRAAREFLMIGELKAWGKNDNTKIIQIMEEYADILIKGNEI